jgi:hypothetical protein
MIPSNAAHDIHLTGSRHVGQVRPNGPFPGLLAKTALVLNYASSRLGCDCMHDDEHFWNNCPWRVSSCAGHTELFSAANCLSRINLLLQVRSRVAVPLGAAPAGPVGLSSPSSSRCLSQLS